MNTPTPRLQAYLFFSGRCEEAVEFYKKAVGAEVQEFMRFKDNPDGCVPEQAPGAENKVMHGSLRIGDSTIMVSDGCGQPCGFDGFSLALSAKDEAEADKLFAALSDGGKVEMPLSATFFSSRFGVTTDRFGVSWMVVAPAPSEK